MIPVLLAASDVSPLLLYLLVILATAALVALVSHRLRLPPIPAYLIAGILIGPFLTRIASAQGAAGGPDPNEPIGGIAKFALLLLIFGVGLHLDISSIRRALGPMILLGVGSTLLSFALVLGVCVAFGVPLPAATVLAMAMSISSTAVVVRELQNRRHLRELSGRLSFATLIMQDLLVILMLAAMGAMTARVSGGGEGSGSLPWLDLLIGGLWRGGAIIAMVLLARAALPRLFHEAARSPSGEVTLVLSAAVALGAGVLASAIGLSPELGAFVAGFLLSATTMRFQIAAQIVSIRDLFMAIFFTSIGMTVEPGVLLESWWLILVGAVGVTVIKTCSITLSAWLVGAPSPTAVTTGLSLAQAGEFSLVLLAAGVSGGLIDRSQAAPAVVIVVLSLMMTPGLIGAAYRVRSHIPIIGLPVLRRAKGLGDQDDHADGHPVGEVIIAGFGPVGRATAERFDKAGIKYTVIEMNTETVRKQQKLGRSIVYGDATSRSVLISAGVEHANVLVLTMPDDEAMIRSCRIARSIDPDLYIVARSTYLSRGLLARTNGADEVIIEEIVTADCMQKAVARAIESQRQAVNDRRQ